ncbi:MAG: hypothetical protein ABGW69_03480 [Nanoarchaeota archaeon]
MQNLIENFFNDKKFPSVIEKLGEMAFSMLVEIDEGLFLEYNECIEENKNLVKFFSNLEKLKYAFYKLNLNDFKKALKNLDYKLKIEFEKDYRFYGYEFVKSPVYIEINIKDYFLGIIKRLIKLHEAFNKNEINESLINKLKELLEKTLIKDFEINTKEDIEKFKESIILALKNKDVDKLFELTIRKSICIPNNKNCKRKNDLFFLIADFIINYYKKGIIDLDKFLNSYINEVDKAKGHNIEKEILFYFSKLENEKEIYNKLLEALSKNQKLLNYLKEEQEKAYLKFKDLNAFNNARKLERMFLFLETKEKEKILEILEEICCLYINYKKYCGKELLNKLKSLMKKHL